MKRFFIGRRAAVLAAGIAVAASGAAPASAQATTARGPHHVTVTRLAPAGPARRVLFTCPDRTVCLFPNDDFTGNYPAYGGPAQLATNAWSGSWISFADVSAANPNPGSMTDNSNSIVWVYDKAEGPIPGINPWCKLAPSRRVLDHSFGYFYIVYGVSSCPATYPVPLPH